MRDRRKKALALIKRKIIVNFRLAVNTAQREFIREKRVGSCQIETSQSSLVKGVASKQYAIAPHPAMAKTKPTNNVSHLKLLRRRQTSAKFLRNGIRG